MRPSIRPSSVRAAEIGDPDASRTMSRGVPAMNSPIESPIENVPPIWRASPLLDRKRRDASSNASRDVAATSGARSPRFRPASATPAVGAGPQHSRFAWWTRPQRRQRPRP